MGALENLLFNQWGLSQATVFYLMIGFLVLFLGFLILTIIHGFKNWPVWGVIILIAGITTLFWPFMEIITLGLAILYWILYWVT